MLISRRPLRQDIREALLGLIFSGDLAPETDINEAALCRSLGVSRTPLREALLLLEQEGLVQSRPNRGWVVTPLSIDVVREVYPIICTLESLALRSSDQKLLKASVDDLNQLNDAMLHAADFSTADAADLQWHERLLEHCPNHRLLDIIRGLKRQAHRYEAVYASESWDVRNAAKQHSAVTAALRRGDVERAVNSLEINWQHALDVISAWLEDASRSGERAQGDVAS